MKKIKRGFKYVISLGLFILLILGRGIVVYGGEGDSREPVETTINGGTIVRKYNYLATISLGGVPGSSQGTMFSYEIGGVYKMTARTQIHLDKCCSCPDINLNYVTYMGGIENRNTLNSGVTDLEFCTQKDMSVVNKLSEYASLGVNGTWTEQCKNCGRKPNGYIKITDFTTYAIYPTVKSQPSALSLNVMGSGQMNVSAEGNLGYEWQQNKGSGFVALQDGVSETGTEFYGTNQSTLQIKNASYFDTQSVFRCKIIGYGYLYCYSNEVPFIVNDVKKPEFSVQYSPEGYAHEITMAVSATDDVMLHSQAYSFDGGNTYQEANTHQITENGMYAVWVRDIAGNIQKKNIAVDKIDRTPPNLSASITKEPTQSPLRVKVTIHASDKGSGLRTSPYFYGNDWHSDNTFTVTENGIYEFGAVDQVGNEVRDTIVIESIVKRNQAPTKEDSPKNPQTTPPPTSQITTEQTNAKPNETDKLKTPTSSSNLDDISATHTTNAVNAENIAKQSVANTSTLVKSNERTVIDASKYETKNTAKKNSGNVTKTEVDNYVRMTEIKNGLKQAKANGEADITYKEKRQSVKQNVSDNQVELGQSDLVEQERLEKARMEKKLRKRKMTYLICGISIVLLLLILALLFFVTVIYSEQKQPDGKIQRMVTGVSLVGFKERAFYIKTKKKALAPTNVFLLFGPLLVLLFENYEFYVYVKEMEGKRLEKTIVQNLRLKGRG